MTLKLYTKTGDTGNSNLIDGKRISKSDTAFDVVGTLDELNACIGLAVVESKKNATDEITPELIDIQHKLLDLGAVFSGSTKALISDQDISRLESRIDYYQHNTREDWYKNFLLPGGTELAARVDVARTVCRRLERVIETYIVNTSDNLQNSEVNPLIRAYINRLSDYLFALRCFINASSGQEETLFKR